MTRGRAIGLAVLACVVVGVVLAEVLTAGGGETTREAPQLPNQVLNGPRVDLASLRGKPALVNFWASWCQPCQQEAPELKRFDRTLGNKANLVGVDWNDTTDNATKFIADSGWQYPILRDPSQAGRLRVRAEWPSDHLRPERPGPDRRDAPGPQTAAKLRQALASAD